MTESWTAIAGTEVNPYADWEIQIRPEFLKDKWTFTLPVGIGLNPGQGQLEYPNWRPIYVGVNGRNPKDLKRNAKAILHASEAELGEGHAPIRLGLDGRFTLKKIIAATTVPPKAECCLFLYLPETFDTGTGDFLNWAEVLIVGPSVPGVSVLDTLAKERIKLPAAPGGGLGGTIAKSPVVTAIIDTELGVANERFCIVENGKRSSRVHHLWRQARENPLKTKGFALGREFGKAAIDRLLEETKGDERAFYDRLRNGKYGVDASIPPLLRGAPADPAAENPRSPEELLDLLIGAFGVPAGIVLPVGKIKPSSIPSYIGEGEARTVGHQAGHGTWVGDIAAGWPLEKAPYNRPIVMVELPDYVVADTQGARLEIYVLMALRRIFEWVDHWPNGTGTTQVPVVVNISLGNSAGPRDGTGALEREIRALLDARNAKTGGKVATCIVMAAGNHYRDRLSAHFGLPGKDRTTLDWNVPPGDASPSFLEIRLPDPADLEVTIRTPGGSEQVADKGNYDLVVDGKTVGRIYVKTDRSLITVALAPTAARNTGVATGPSGTWQVVVKNVGRRPVNNIKVDIQRDDTLTGWPQYGVQSWLDHPTARTLDRETGKLDLPERNSPISRRGTLSAFATGAGATTVGAAYRLAPGDPDKIIPTLYTGSGPAGSRNEGKPDYSAVAEDGRSTPGMLASGYFSGSAAIFSGTSGAAPQWTRALVDQLSGQPAPALLAVAVNDPLRLRLGAGTLEPKSAPGRRIRRAVMG